jgi:hypothetical protein
VTDLDQEWDYPSPHILHTHVRAEDIDGLNHTNNLVYVDWCQKAAWTHSEALGLDLNCYRELDRAMVIAHSEFDYLRASQEGSRYCEQECVSCVSSSVAAVPGVCHRSSLPVMDQRY